MWLFVSVNCIPSGKPSVTGMCAKLANMPFSSGVGLGITFPSTAIVADGYCLTLDISNTTRLAQSVSFIQLRFQEGL